MPDTSVPPVLPVDASLGALVYKATYQAVGRVAVPLVIKKSRSSFSALSDNADMVFTFQIKKKL